MAAEVENVMAGITPQVKRLSYWDARIRLIDGASLTTGAGGREIYRHQINPG
jgi:hypothetical protein